MLKKKWSKCNIVIAHSSKRCLRISHPKVHSFILNYLFEYLFYLLIISQLLICHDDISSYDKNSKKVGVTLSR